MNFYTYYKLYFYSIFYPSSVPDDHHKIYIYTNLNINFNALKKLQIIKKFHLLSIKLQPPKQVYLIS